MSIRNCRLQDRQYAGKSRASVLGRILVILELQTGQQAKPPRFVNILPRGAQAVKGNHLFVSNLI